MKFKKSDILKTFFRLMMHGYAGEGHIQVVSPGVKSVVYNDIETGLTGTDTWQTTPLGIGSFGTIVISSPAGAVWMMQFYGEYPKLVIPFLKVALAENYSKGLFRCGRGPLIFCHGGLRYMNWPDRSDWANFRGREQIRNETTGEVLGWHNFHGMALVPVEK